MLFMSTTCKLERYLNPLKHPHTLMFASLPSRAWDTLSTIPTIIVWVLAFYPKVVGQFYGVPWKKGGWRILKRNTNCGYPLNGQHPHPVQAGSTILQPYCFTLINLLSSYFSWNPPKSNLGTVPVPQVLTYVVNLLCLPSWFHCITLRLVLCSCLWNLFYFSMYMGNIVKLYCISGFPCVSNIAVMTHFQSSLLYNPGPNQAW